MVKKAKDRACAEKSIMAHRKNNRRATEEQCLLLRRKKDGRIKTWKKVQNRQCTKNNENSKAKDKKALLNPAKGNKSRIWRI